ncbi:UNVERIFIED_CONTAM: hypothetical protein RMT77_003550 [Armadillidium vulgare]
MQGLSLAGMKKHPSLIPLFFCIALGAAGAFGYTMRLAFKNPDVSWNKKSNPEPNEEYANKQYKFYSPVRDYSTYKTNAPDYKE